MSAAIEVKKLSFSYRDGTKALDRVSFSAVEGECVGIIGPNGAGKSTLLLHLNGLLPESGKGTEAVVIEGVVAVGENLPEIRRKVGLLFQDPNDQLFCPTVFEDVAFGPSQFGIGGAELDALVASSLSRAGLAGYERRQPHHLSAGEKRRACLAAVLACGPSILVLDEPTANLDPRGRRELKELLRGIPITKIIATHDLELVADLCSRVVLMDCGRVVADGPAREILSDEALMLAHGLERPHCLSHPHPHG